MDMMQQTMALAMVLAPATTAVVQVVKSAVPLPKTLVPFIGLAVGVALGAAAYPFTELPWDMRLWAGGFSGLASVGLFELFNKRDGTTK